MYFVVRKKHTQVNITQLEDKKKIVSDKLMIPKKNIGGDGFL